MNRDISTPVLPQESAVHHLGINLGRPILALSTPVSSPRFFVAKVKGKNKDDTISFCEISRIGVGEGGTRDQNREMRRREFLWRLALGTFGLEKSCIALI
jgi:hypothetical protein